MIKTKFAAAAGIAVAALTLTASAQQATQAGVAGLLPDGKIAVINTAAFQDRIGELKQKYDVVNGQFQDRYKELQEIDQRVKDLENKINTQSAPLAQEKVQEMRDQYDNLKRLGQRKLEDFQAEYNKALDNATRPVRDKLGQFVQNYATQRGIILIIRLPEAYQTGILAYSSPGVDITDEFINEYNKANPVPVSAPASKPGATSPSTPPKPGAKPQ